MQLDEIEESILTKLKDDEAIDVAVEAFPDNPSKYKLIHHKGAALVAYRDSDHDDVGGSQETEKVTFVISVLLRNLRQHKESYAILSLIKDSLKNFYPLKNNQISTLRITKSRYIKQNEGVWQYDQVYEATIYVNNAC